MCAVLVEREPEADGRPKRANVRLSVEQPDRDVSAVCGFGRSLREPRASSAVVPETRAERFLIAAFAFGYVRDVQRADSELPHASEVRSRDVGGLRSVMTGERDRIEDRVADTVLAHEAPQTVHFGDQWPLASDVAH